MAAAAAAAVLPDACRYPIVQALHKDVAFGVRLWAPPEHCGQELVFNVSFVVQPGTGSGATGWNASE